MFRNSLRTVRSTPSQNQIGLSKESWADLDDEGGNLGITDLVNTRPVLQQKDSSSAVHSAMEVLSKSLRVMEAELLELRAENEKLQARANRRRSSHRTNDVIEHKAEMLSVMPQAPSSRPRSTDNIAASPVASDGVFMQDVSEDLDDAELHIAQDIPYESESRGAPCSPMEVWSSRSSAQDEVESLMSMTDAQFEVLPIWACKIGKKASIGSKSKRFLRGEAEDDALRVEQLEWFRSMKTRNLSMRSETTLMERHPRRFSIMVHPNSPFRGAWDISSLVMVIYDMIVIPFQLFEPPETMFGIVMAWITRLFWTLDMPLSCVTGLILPDGSVQMNIWFIMKRYLKTWFLLDLFIVSIDWIELIWAAGGAVAYARLGKASRIFRIIRLLRLLRIVRIREVAKVIIERLRSERLVIMAHILKMTCVIAGVAHVVACLWYGLGMTYESDNDAQSWIKAHVEPSFSIGYRYLCSLHWAASQFSGGMDEIRPQNALERLYAVICFLIGFMIAAVIVSSVTSSMTQLHLLTTQQSKHMLVLRRFLTEHSISNKLCVRVLRSATHALAEQQRFVPEANVEMLDYVSKSLRSHLHFEMFAPHFAQHPWFARYSEECPHVMRHVCHSATLLTFCSHGDAIFHAGEMPEEPKFYILVSGKLRYKMLNDEVTNVDENNWMSEPTLWTRWTHRGSLVSLEDSRMLVLDANRFQSIVSRFGHDEFDPRMYAAEFVGYLNILGADASDLPIPTDTLNGDLFRNSMPSQANAPGMFQNFRKSLRSTQTKLSLFDDD